MAKPVECVPNFSEGRRTEVVDSLAEAVAATPGVLLLDQTSDPDHNRSVLTFAGDADPVQQAMEAAVGIALARIDMEHHEGQHPRIGAVDVIPFVPLGETTMEDCVSVARRFGARIAARFDLPVYLYAEAATRSDRRVLSDIRKPQYEGLKRLVSKPGWQPDYGPAALHPRGGAVAVGARPFLIAFNINLETDDVGLARRIANRIRERSGGMPRVQALGLYLEDVGCAQVSMNLLDFSVTPLWQVWETVGALASAESVSVRESELVGLAPVAALVEVADHVGPAPGGSLEERISAAAAWLQIRDFDPGRALELRLAAASGAVSGAAGGG